MLAPRKSIRRTCPPSRGNDTRGRAATWRSSRLDCVEGGEGFGWAWTIRAGGAFGKAGATGAAAGGSGTFAAVRGGGAFATGGGGGGGAFAIDGGGGGGDGDFATGGG